MGDVVTCPECGNEYKSIGLHWYHNPSHRPALTEYQTDILTGLQMSDGSLNRKGGKNKNPLFMVSMITKEYLEWLDNIFGILTTGVSLQTSASEKAQNNRDSGFSPNAKEENYHDIWRLRTRSLPELKQFDWYTGPNGGKVWPDNIELTPTVLTHLYIGDGHWNNSGTSNCIQIAAANEIGNEDKIDSYFKRVNLPTPSNYSTSERKNGSVTMGIEFTKEDSYELFEYMDDPPPGFEYKFPPEYR